MEVGNLEEREGWVQAHEPPWNKRAEDGFCPPSEEGGRKIYHIDELRAARSGRQTVLDKKPVYHMVKRGFDIVCSLLGLIVLSPLFCVVAVLIKLEDGGPVIHKRWCVGKKGKYAMLKFRTMMPDADERLDLFTEEQREQYMQGVKIEHDPRITRIGRFLRATSIDELPQLVTVLRSEMSLVGPRPVIEREAEAYGDQRELLLSCKAGITGLWQVKGRGSIPYLSEEARSLQLYYVEHQGFRMDRQILLETVKIVLSRKGAR